MNLTWRRRDWPVESADAVDVHVLQLVVVGDPLDDSGIGVGVAGARHRVALGRDERVVELDVKTVRCLAAPEVKASVVHLRARFPGQGDVVGARFGGEGEQGDGGGRPELKRPDVAGSDSPKAALVNAVDGGSCTNVVVPGVNGVAVGLEGVGFRRAEAGVAPRFVVELGFEAAGAVAVQVVAFGFDRNGAVCVRGISPSTVVRHDGIDQFHCTAKARKVWILASGSQVIAASIWAISSSALRVRP